MNGHDMLRSIAPVRIHKTDYQCIPKATALRTGDGILHLIGAQIPTTSIHRQPTPRITEPLLTIPHRYSFLCQEMTASKFTADWSYSIEYEFIGEYAPLNSCCFFLRGEE